MSKRKKMEDAMQDDLASLKKTLPAPKKVREVAQKQHLKEVVDKKAKTQRPATKPKKAITRTTFDFPADVHKAAKKAAADEYTTLKGYVMMILKRDLKDRGYL